MEGLWLVEFHPVLSAHLICVRVLLSAPVGAVPVLAVPAVTCCQFAALQRHHLEHICLFKLNSVVTGPPVVLSLGGGVEIALSEGSRVVVNWVHIRRTPHLSLCPVATGSCMQLHISFRNSSRVEAG